MTGYVVHTPTGQPRSYGTTAPTDLPNNWTFTEISDDDYRALTVTGTGAWDPGSFSVVPKPPPDPEPIAYGEWTISVDTDGAIVTTHTEEA